MQVRMRRISITTRLLSYLVLAGLVPLVLLGTSAFEISRRIIIKQAGEFHLQQVNDLQAYLSLYSDQVESLAANIAGNEAISEALRVGQPSESRGTDTYSALTTQAQIGYILNSYVRVKGLVSIDLFSRDGKHFHVGDTLEVRDIDTTRVTQLLTQAGESTAPAFWRGIEDNLNQASRQSKVLTVTRAIRYYAPQSGATDVIGLLVINIDANQVINEFLSAVKTPQHLRLMLLDRNGRFAYHSNPALLGQSAAPGLIDLVKSGPPVQEVKLDGQEVILSFVALDRIGGGLIGVLPRSVLTAPTSALIYAGLILLLIGIAGIGLLAWRFARHVVVPVRDVSEGFSRLQEHPESPPAALPLPQTRDEMTDLVVGFNKHLEVLATQKIAAQQLMEAQHGAEEASRAKSQFLATMSHEIRTPMNGILGMAQMLLMDDISEAERRDFARTILNSGRSLLTILNDILDFSKIEAGKLELDKSVIDPGQLLSETVSLFRENAADKGLTLEARWDGATQHYLADSQRLSQMLSNLTNNAIKFTSSGHVSLLAKEVDRSNDEALIEFSVSDTGVGIEEDKQKLLFKPFSQADGSITRQFGGTGLGLSIVRSLALKMGGDVGVDSEPGQGSRFWFRVRAGRIDDEMDRRDSRRIVEEIAVTSAQLNGNILVVEDNLTNQKVIQTLLKKLGLSCQIASDGQAGLQAVMSDPSIELIFMDVHMPIMDGHAATKKIRAWETESQQTRRSIIALTADAFEKDRQLCIDAGMDDFLTKPISLDKLTLALQRWLRPRPVTG